MCVYVCMHACVCVWACAVYVCVCEWVHVCMYACVCICMHVCMSLIVFVPVCVCIYNELLSKSSSDIDMHMVHRTNEIYKNLRSF